MGTGTGGSLELEYYRRYRGAHMVKLVAVVFVIALSIVPYISPSAL